MRGLPQHTQINYFQVILLQVTQATQLRPVSKYFFKVLVISKFTSLIQWTAKPVISESDRHDLDET